MSLGSGEALQLDAHVLAYQRTDVTEVMKMGRFTEKRACVEKT